MNVIFQANKYFSKKTDLHNSIALNVLNVKTNSHDLLIGVQFDGVYTRACVFR